jgi:hypothetical protein
MDCNKSKMKKKKYMKENEEFMALKDYYKNILSEATRAIAQRTDLIDFNPRDVHGNKRNPIDYPFKKTGESRGILGFVQGKPAPRFVNPKDTARSRPPRTKPSVDKKGRDKRLKYKIATLRPRMNYDPETGLNFAADALERRGFEVPPIDPKNLPPFHEIEQAYDIQHFNRARGNKYFK